jgi:hypothetical protein
MTQSGFNPMEYYWVEPLPEFRKIDEKTVRVIFFTQFYLDL